MKQIKLAFELNVPNKSGVIYDGKFLDTLETFIKDSGIVFMQDDNKLSINNFIGVVVSYNIVKDKFIILNMNILNDRFNVLNNVDGYLDGLPRVIGVVDENNIARVEKVESIEVIV